MYPLVAAKIIKYLGRNVEHVRVWTEEVVKVYQNAWFPETSARFMAGLEELDCERRGRKSGG